MKKKEKRIRVQAPRIGAKGKLLDIVTEKVFYYFHTRLNFYNFQEKNILAFPLAPLKTNIDCQNRDFTFFKTRQSGSSHDLSRNHISLNYRQFFTVIGYSRVSYSQQRFLLLLLIPIRYGQMNRFVLFRRTRTPLERDDIYLKTPGYRCRRYYFFTKYWAARPTLFSFRRYQRGAKKYLSDRRGHSQASPFLVRRSSCEFHVTLEALNGSQVATKLDAISRIMIPLAVRLVATAFTSAFPTHPSHHASPSRVGCSLLVLCNVLSRTHDTSSVDEEIVGYWFTGSTLRLTRIKITRVTLKQWAWRKPLDSLSPNIYTHVSPSTQWPRFNQA